MADFWVVLWKEWRELVRETGTWVSSGWRTNLLVYAGLGVFIGTRTGAGSVGFVTCWVGMMVASLHGADGFAGERERRTLETLYTLPLSDRAIATGKVAASIGYGGVMLMVFYVGAALAAGTVGERWSISPAAIGMILIIAVCATAGASFIAALVSFRSTTVKQAQQTLLTLFIAVATLLFLAGWGLFAGVRAAFPPESVTRAAAWLLSRPIESVLLAGLLLLLIVNAGLMTAVIRTCRRDRAILEVADH